MSHSILIVIGSAVAAVFGALYLVQTWLWSGLVVFGVNQADSLLLGLLGVGLMALGVLA